jgi:ABC-type sulfate transport system substrate-binding protein
MPVYFYGMPNGKIQVMYAKFCDTQANKAGLEFVFADHEDFVYDYESDKIYAQKVIEISKMNFMQMVDQPDQRIKVFSVNDSFNSYAEAQHFLNNKLHNKLDYFVMEQMF